MYDDARVFVPEVRVRSPNHHLARCSGFLRGIGVRALLDTYVFLRLLRLLFQPVPTVSPRTCQATFLACDSLCSALNILCEGFGRTCRIFQAAGRYSNISLRLLNIL